MKTLKQLLIEECNGISEDTFEVSEIYRAIEKWLKQKLKPIADDLAKYAINSQDSAKFTLIALKLDEIFDELGDKTHE